MYSMQAVASFLFRVICFPFNGNIIMIDQKSFHNLSVNASSGASIPIIYHSQPATGSVDVGMYPYPMGTFRCPMPVLMIGSSFGGASSLSNSVSFHTTHMEDPWILPPPNPLNGPIKMDMPFPVTMIAYQVNLDCVVEPSPSSSQMEEEDSYVFPAWAVESSHAHDFLDDVFPLDEAIIEAMSGVEPPWEELHHRSYFLLELDRMERDDFRDILSENIGSPMVPLRSRGQMADGNMANLSPTNPINISYDLGKVENVYIGPICSPDEIEEYTELFK